jgi:hypothetical protein
MAVKVTNIIELTRHYQHFHHWKERSRPQSYKTCVQLILLDTQHSLKPMTTNYGEMSLQAVLQMVFLCFHWLVLASICQVAAITHTGGTADL